MQLNGTMIRTTDETHPKRSAWLTVAGVGIALFVLTVGSGCASLAINARMLHYRTTLAGTIGKWKTADFERKYGPPHERKESGEGRQKTARWLYHFKAEGRRGYDDLSLVFDSEGYLGSWNVQITR